MDLNLFQHVKLKGYFFKILGIFFLTIILSVIFSIAFGKDILSGRISIITFTINFAILILTLLELKKNNINIKNVIGKPEKKSFIFEVPVALMLTYIAGIGMILILLYIVYNVNPHIFQGVSNNLSDTREADKSTVISIISFIDLVILAPVLEEIIFRGILLSKFYSKYGIWKAIIITSLIFFMVHFKTNPMTLVVGITNCILVLKYKSLIPAMLVHGINNFIFFMKNFRGSAEDSAPLEVNICVLIIGIIMTGIYAIYLYKNRPKSLVVSEGNSTL